MTGTVYFKKCIQDSQEYGSDEGREAVVLPLRSEAFDERRTPAATNREIREYVMLKAAWSDRLGARGCNFDKDDAWRLGVDLGLIHNAEQLLIDDDLLTKEGQLTRPTLKLVERFENGQIGHAPPLLEALTQRLDTPRYEAAHEQVTKALDAFRAEKHDLAEAANSAVRAVESLAKIVTGRPNETLGDIVKNLKAKGELRAPLHKVFDAIYGYRGTRPGLGHGGTIPSDTDLREATLVYNSAAACIEFLLDLDRP